MIEIKAKSRVTYVMLFLILLLCEIYIALFINDNFIHPFGGDFLVTILLCCLIRIFKPDGIKLLPLYVFVFSVCVEIAQYFDYVSLLGLEKSEFFSVLMGRSFSIYDIVCYGAGCIVFFVVENIFWEILNNEVNIMNKNYKKIVKTYFSFTKYWLIGMILLTILVIALAAAMVYYGEYSRVGKAVWIVAVPVISLYQSFHMIPFWINSKKDLKNGEIATKRITVDNIGMDIDHNYAVKGARVVGRMKYAIVDTDGDFYYIYPAGGKKMVLDTVIEGKSLDVTYLKNTSVVLEMQLDFRDNANPVYDNFKNMFPHYFETHVY